MADSRRMYGSGFGKTHAVGNESDAGSPNQSSTEHDEEIQVAPVTKEAAGGSLPVEDVRPKPDLMRVINSSAAANDFTSARQKRTLAGQVLDLLLWMPQTCRYNPENPPKFTMGMNFLFSFATTATVGNLYYNQAILYKIADFFDVSYERGSNIATLMQAGYAGGIILLCPLADILPRRPYILFLVVVTALLWIGLCVTQSFEVFAALSFLCGFTTVTPQLMLPLVGDLAPPHRRATAIAIVVSGLSLGMLIARLLAGVVANYTSWRNIYWISLGLQVVVFVSLYFFMPDYPNKNGHVWTEGFVPGAADGNGNGTRVKAGPIKTVMHFCKMLYMDIALLFFRHAKLTQACIIVFCISSVFTSYWTTLSFLLASPPYEYPSYAIGLFGLIGIVVICLGPFYSRYVIDKIMPIVAVLMATVVEIVFVGIGVGIGTFCIAGPVLQAVFIDFSNQSSNVALRASIYDLAPSKQNRVNATYMIAAFLGQLTGTSAGNHLYAMGGWRYSGALSLGMLCFAVFICLLRGPRETGLIGWHGGWPIRKDRAMRKPTEARSASGAEEIIVVPPGEDSRETTGATEKA